MDSARIANARPSASMFGQEMLASIAATPGTLTAAARLANPSAVGAEIDTTSGTPHARYSGSVCFRKYGTPLDGMPMAFSMPPATSATRGSGLPARSSRVMVLVTSAPMRARSTTSPRPSAKVPDAGITGLASVRPRADRMTGDGGRPIPGAGGDGRMKPR